MTTNVKSRLNSNVISINVVYFKNPTARINNFLINKKNDTIRLIGYMLSVRL